MPGRDAPVTPSVRRRSGSRRGAGHATPSPAVGRVRGACRWLRLPSASVAEQHIRAASGTADGGALQVHRRGSGEERRCGWCRRILPQQGSVGRPRLYCGQACRQRAYEQRSAAAKAGLSDDVVLVSRAELDGLQDRLYQLRCALEDVQTLLTERPTKAELERSLADLVRSTGRLDRLWVAERAG